MILRTPPPKRHKSDPENLVIVEEPPSAGADNDALALEHSHAHSDDQMLCTYQCRQMVKSEFIDALSSAEQQVIEYRSRLEELNGSYSTAEAERSKFQDRLLYAEQELAAAKGREQALKEQLLKEVGDFQERTKKQIQSYSELEVKLQNEMNIRKKAELSAASAEEKVILLEGKLSKFSESIEREKMSLHNELGELRKESALSVSRIGVDLERMECRAINAEQEAALLQKQLENLKQQLNESLNQKGEFQTNLSSSVSQDIESSETNILVKHLREELRNYESEVLEARRLKSSHENIELLKQKLLEERGRRERSESELLELQELRPCIKKLEDELSSWNSLIKDVPDVSCRNDIPVKFAALQKELLESMMKLGEANARLKQMEVALDAAKLGKQNAETEAALAKEATEVSKAEVKRLKMMLSVVSEERDALKNTVDGYKRSPNNAGSEANTGAVILELRSSITKKEYCIKELESHLNEQQKINDRQHSEIKLLNERLNNEAKRVKSLERESDRLRSEISLLESKLGHGDYSADNTKVLRMVNTLAVDNEAKQTIEALQSELQKTKEKLQALEELKSQSGDANLLVDSHISGKIMQLKDQIATLEKREERYKTVFADRISVFRRACCELFGYKILMDEQKRPNGIPVTHFTLQSIYAQSDDEKLEFEYESGNTNIMANDYTSQRDISQQIEIFIRKMNSIPAFTANLTVESFNRRTLT